MLEGVNASISEDGKNISFYKENSETKETVLLPYEGGYIADTPGFSSLDLELYKEQIEKELLIAVDEALEKLYQYGEENLYELYSAYIPIAEADMEADFFYQPVIKNIIADNTNKIQMLEVEFSDIYNN